MSMKMLYCLGVFSIISFCVMNVECFSAPISGTKSNKTLSNASIAVDRPVSKTKGDAALNAATDLTVIYLPYNPNIHRLYGISPINMIQALIEFRATGNSHPLGFGSSAIVIHSPSQKELLLGLLDTRRTSVKSKEGESELLVTEPAWNKSIIIDQYGTVADGFHLYQDQQELFQGLAQHNLQINDFYEYKLPPNVLDRLLNLMKTLSFPQQSAINPAASIPKSAPVGFLTP